MKKLFTLVALLVCFLGAKAEWVEDYKIDYSTLTNFPFYPMGYVPEFVNGVMVDYGAAYRYATQDVLDNGDSEGKGKLEAGESVVGTAMAGTDEYQKVTGAGPYWHQYMIASNVPMVLDGAYTIKAVVKASAAVNANLQFGNWGKLVEKAVTIPAGDDFQEVEWEVTGCTNNGSGFICIQPGTSEATIEWKSLTVSHFEKPQRPTVWQEWLNSDGQPFVLDGTATNDKYMGDAETPWGELANVKFDDAENNFKVCAWSKERGVNLGEPDADGNQPWNPFPATIEVDPDNADNHVFVCHGKAAVTEGDAAAWDNQFWIQSPKSWKAGDQVKISFRYKASKEVETETQTHLQTPSNYLIWHAIGNITFKEEWQTFEKVVSWESDMDGGWSVAFNLNAKDKEAIDFYFDDLSWKSMKLDQGYFVASANPTTGIEYDFANAPEFTLVTEEGDYEGLLTATVGTAGKKDTWVSEVMISTVRGNDTAFKSATLKPTTVADGEWGDYSESSLAKIKLEAAGVWTIYIDTESKQMSFEKVEGDVKKDPVDVITNPEVIVVHALEREPTAAEQPADDEAGIPAGTGNAWDNQFFLVANRVLDAGEETIVEFDYVATLEAKTTTQAHAKPGEYVSNDGIGDVVFKTVQDHFKGTFTVPSGKTTVQTIAFNMAEIKDACDYTIKNVKWYVKSGSDEEGLKTDENLINATGGKNFAYKVVGGQITYVEDPTGITNVVTKKAASNVTYNLAGQRVSKDFKGIIIKDGKKFMNK